MESKISALPIGEEKKERKLVGVRPVKVREVRLKFIKGKTTIEEAEQMIKKNGLKFAKIVRGGTYGFKKRVVIVVDYHKSLYTFKEGEDGKIRYAYEESLGNILSQQKPNSLDRAYDILRPESNPANYAYVRTQAGDFITAEDFLIRPELHGVAVVTRTEGEKQRERELEAEWKPEEAISHFSILYFFSGDVKAIDITPWARDEGYLFGLDKEFGAELDKRTISQKMRSQMKKNGLDLSRNARVKKVKEAERWEIEDGKQRYWIKKDNKEPSRELSVYDEGGYKEPVLIKSIEIKTSPRGLRIPTYKIYLHAKRKDGKPWRYVHIFDGSNGKYAGAMLYEDFKKDVEAGKIRVSKP